MSTRYWDEIDWYIQEGMEKLCEMLNTDKENEDASSSKWSLGEDDQDRVENGEGAEEVMEEQSLEKKKKEKKSETGSLKDEASDGDSEKDDEEYMERSTSVEDEKTAIIQTKTKVDELVSLCNQCSMLPPIYTYFTTGDDQVVSTVQLWNGVRFSSHSQVNRDKAMEEAAQQAISYLKIEQQSNRPVSTSPPSTYPYLASTQGMVQAVASVGSPYYVQAAQYAPVTYSQPQPAYFGYPMSSNNAIPIPVIPHAPIITMSGYQHPSIVPSYRFDQLQYLPPPQRQIIQMQHSPSHHPNKGLPVYHPPSGPPKPIMWNGGTPVGPCYDAYALQNTAIFHHPSVPRPRTQFQLRDTPFIPLQVSKKQVKTDPTPIIATSSPQSVKNQDGSESKATRNQKTQVALTAPKSATSSKSSKAKLAISFGSGRA